MTPVFLVIAGWLLVAVQVWACVVTHWSSPTCIGGLVFCTGLAIFNMIMAADR